MNETSQAKSNLSVPAAIVVAGALIAAALFFSRGAEIPSNVQQNPTTNTNTQQVSASTMAIKPIGADDHTLGNPAAPIAFIVYTDLECPFCKSFHSTMQRVADTYGKEGDVLWIYRHFPLDQLHPKADKEAEATECAAEQGGNQAFWDYTNKLFETTPSNNGLDLSQLPVIAQEVGLDKTAFTACLSSDKYAERVESQYQEAVGAGGRGTPFSIIVLKKPISDLAKSTITQLASLLSPGSPIVSFSSDGKRVGLSGALPYSSIEQIIKTLSAE